MIDWLWGDPCQDDDETVPVLFMDVPVETDDEDENEA